ncbi:MAG TPA: RES family NAD+ phosphorylase [Woeseiaceae bacterium]|nr:RES family NAD+ phosphorylase [Woeseiaceae bacterium]
MSVTVYRLAKLRYRDQIFSGLGGLYAHGRWTSRGRPVVYASGSIALAALEYTVNYRRRGWVPESVLGRAEIPDDGAIDTVQPVNLPDNWLDANPPPALQEIGEDWLRKATTAVLKVPSVAVPEEWNYLLSPRHADFARLVIKEPEPFQFDRRLSRTRKRGRKS